jgi:hypothetical protein
MSTPALLSLRILAVIAIVARRLVPDALDALASVAKVNAAARRASGVYDIAPAATADAILDEATMVIGTRSSDDAAVALAEEAWIAGQTLRAASSGLVHAAVYGHILEAVAAVELAARTSPAGAAPEDIASGNWTGPRYVGGREISKITADLRRDLSVASRLPGALRGVSCRVRKIGHLALEIEVVAVPDHAILLNPSRIEIEMNNPHVHTGLAWQSSRGLAINVALLQLAHAYGLRRGSCTEFHVSVIFAESIKQKQKLEIETAVRLASKKAAS